MKKSRVFIRRRGIKILSFVLAALLVLCVTGIAMSASEGGHEEGHGDGHAATKGWVPTDTYRVMNFSVLAIALFFLLKKPVSNALSGRIEGIREQLSSLEAQKDAAQKEVAEYTQKLSLLEEEAQKIIAEYEKQGEDAKAKILKEAEAAAQKLEEQAKRHIEYEFKQAKMKLQEEIFEKSLVKAEEVIKTHISETDQDRLVDEYLQKVVA
jgi:F-type H+-transporting ATPase subunit b